MKIKRKAWALVVVNDKGKPTRFVDLYGGLSVYSSKREAEIDCDTPYQKVVRVIVEEE